MRMKGPQCRFSTAAPSLLSLYSGTHPPVVQGNCCTAIFQLKEPGCCSLHTSLNGVLLCREKKEAATMVNLRCGPFILQTNGGLTTY